MMDPRSLFPGTMFLSLDLMVGQYFDLLGSTLTRLLFHASKTIFIQNNYVTGFQVGLLSLIKRFGYYALNQSMTYQDQGSYPRTNLGSQILRGLYVWLFQLILDHRNPQTYRAHDNYFLKFYVAYLFLLQGRHHLARRESYQLGLGAILPLLGVVLLGSSSRVVTMVSLAQVMEGKPGYRVAPYLGVVGASLILLYLGWISLNHRRANKKFNDLLALTLVLIPLTTLVIPLVHKTLLQILDRLEVLARGSIHPTLFRVTLLGLSQTKTLIRFAPLLLDVGLNFWICLGFINLESLIQTPLPRAQGHLVLNLVCDLILYLSSTLVLALPLVRVIPNRFKTMEIYGRTLIKVLFQRPFLGLTPHHLRRVGRGVGPLYILWFLYLGAILAYMIGGLMESILVQVALYASGRVGDRGLEGALNQLKTHLLLLGAYQIPPLLGVEGYKSYTLLFMTLLLVERVTLAGMFSPR